jgi:hypothetical protein
MASYTSGPGTSFLMMRVLVGGVNLALVARKARPISHVRCLELVPTTGRMTVQTVNFTRFYAWAHDPGCVRVILAEITAIRIIIGIFKGYQVKVVKKTVPRFKIVRQRYGFGVTGRTSGVVLFMREISSPSF